jgi:FkbH-like protein
MTPAVTEEAGIVVAQSIKLIVWDIDDTLWEGTLDESSNVVLDGFRANMIRLLNTRGIVSAICSKNDHEIARAKLIELEIWDEFVFPRIAFEPKGPALQRLIADMQLRPQNVLFIDDNPVNLAEAKAVLPELHVVDATSGQCNDLLLTILRAHADVEKNRVAEYRSLEARLQESAGFDGGREAFLHSCNINVAVVWRSDLIDFTDRIEELINRTNQLNFLKTRAEPGSTAIFATEVVGREGYALFAWDRFGYHGLVGFIAADVRENKLLHMAFSCRIMHMGMESWLLSKMLRLAPNLEIPADFPVKASVPPWIAETPFHDPRVRAFIYAHEKAAAGPQEIKLRIIANCQSGAWVHFSGLRNIAEIDNWPRVFNLRQMLDESYRDELFPPALVYSYLADCMNLFWPPELHKLLEDGVVERCAEKLARYLQERGCRMLLIGAPRDLPDEMFQSEGLGGTRRRVELFNRTWERLAARYDCLSLLDIESIVGKDGMMDWMHFAVDANRDIGAAIGRWYQSTLANEVVPS